MNERNKDSHSSKNGKHRYGRKLESHVPVIVIGNLPLDVTRAELYEECSRYGNVVDIKLFEEPLTRRPLGEAEVYYVTKNDTDYAMIVLRNLQIRGQRARVMIVRYSKDAFIPDKLKDPSL